MNKKSDHLKILVDSDVISHFISFHSVKVLPLPVDNVPCMREFARLLRTFGQGESACMAYARFNESIIASSNLTDIHAYCLENKIQYLTTMDILLEALEGQLICEEEANVFIARVKGQKSWLPVDTIEEYRKRIRHP